MDAGREIEPGMESETEPVTKAAMERGLGAEAVRSLLRAGANANAADPDGSTLLHLAAQTENLEIANLLLAAGANPNAATRPGVETGGFMRDVRTRAETPLHRAAATSVCSRTCTRGVLSISLIRYSDMLLASASPRTSNVTLRADLAR